MPHVVAVEHVVHERAGGRAEPRRRSAASRRPSRAPRRPGRSRRRSPISTSSGRGATSAATSTCSSAPSLAGHDLRAAHVPRDRVRGAPRRQVAGDDRDADPLVERGEEQRARAAVRQPGRSDRAGSTSGCAPSTSSARCRSQRLRSSGTTPAIVAQTRSQSQWYLSSGIQSARSPKPRRSGASTT